MQSTAQDQVKKKQTEFMSSSSDDESDNNQENDQQMSDDSFEEMYDMDTELFTQENYYFLFDKQM